MARIGILGGTFNPPHVGHLVCAREALDQLGLDRVLLMPVAVPPHKPSHDDPGASQRIGLCELAVVADTGLAVSDLEVRRGGPSYTVETLRELHETSPTDELTLIVGADMARSFPAWRDPGGILALARLAVVERDDVGRDEILEQLALLPAAADRVTFFQMPRLDVSSSLIRARVGDGRSIRDLVPEAVAEVIAQRGWYRRDPSPYPGR